MSKGKFVSMIERSGDDVLKGRGGRIIKSARLAQETLITALEQQLLSMEDDQEIMLDQSPDNRFSLTVGEKFKPKDWVDEYQALSIKVAEKRVELEIAQKNLEMLFSTDGETAADSAE